MKQSMKCTLTKQHTGQSLQISQSLDRLDRSLALLALGLVVVAVWLGKRNTLLLAGSGLVALGSRV